MSEIKGLDKEYEFVKKWNGKRILELDPLLKNVIEDLYPNVYEESLISCWKNHYKQKADIIENMNKNEVTKWKW